VLIPKHKAVEIGSNMSGLFLNNTGSVPYTLRAVAIRTLDKPRPVMLGSSLLSADALRVVERDDIGLVIECIGGRGSRPG
jgi:hypothetical protein